jgi:hypothetical protein
VTCRNTSGCKAYVNELQNLWRPCGEEADGSLMVGTRRGNNDQHGQGHWTLAPAACPVPLWAEVGHGEPRAEAGMRGLFGILAAGPFFFVSAWVLMLFAGVVDIDVGIRPFGYITSMIVTIALWLTMAPVIGSISRVGRRNG